MNSRRMKQAEGVLLLSVPRSRICFSVNVSYLCFDERGCLIEFWCVCWTWVTLAESAWLVFDLPTLGGVVGLTDDHASALNFLRHWMGKVWFGLNKQNEWKHSSCRFHVFVISFSALMISHFYKLPSVKLQTNRNCRVVIFGRISYQRDMA